MYGGRLKSITTLVKGFASARTSLGAVLQTGFANILIQAAYFGSGVITARSLGPSGRGALAAIIMWPQFLSYLMTLGVPTSSVYHVRKDPEHASHFVAAATLLSVLTGSAAILVGQLAIPYSLHTYPPAVIHFARFAVFLAPLALLGITLSTQVQSAGAFRSMNIFRVAQPAMVLCVLFVTWRLFGLTAYSASLAYLLAGIPITIWNFVWVYKHFHPTLRGGFEASRQLLNYGVRVWGADLLSTVSNQVDRILIVSMLAPRLMGLYVVSQGIAGLLNPLPSAMSTVLMPKAAGKSVPEIVELTGRAVRITLVGLLAVACPLFLAGGFLLRLVYGNKYDGAAAILKILLCEGILDGMTSVLSQAFLAAGVPGTVTLLEGCGLLTAVPLMYWMIPRWGLPGAACALLTATFIRFLFVYLNFPLRFRQRPPGLLLGASDLTLLRRS